MRLTFCVCMCVWLPRCVLIDVYVCTGVGGYWTWNVVNLFLFSVCDRINGVVWCLVDGVLICAIDACGLLRW